MDKTKQTVDVFNKHAYKYAEKFMDVSLYKDTFDLFCDSIFEKDAEVLELACGPCNITKYLLEKRSDLKILGTDLAPRMLEIAKKNNPSAQFQLMDCKDMSHLGKQFNAILFGFCLPYLSKEEAIEIIYTASKMLKPKGILYISTMEDKYEHSGLQWSSDGKDQIFMHYHQEDYLVEAIKNSGLEILLLERKEIESPKNTATHDLILLAAK
jgi:ubiquinone/menaquinone biosynthesis C-methylase UbiE